MRTPSPDELTHLFHVGVVLNSCVGVHNPQLLFSNTRQRFPAPLAVSAIRGLGSAYISDVSQTSLFVSSQLLFLLSTFRICSSRSSAPHKQDVLGALSILMFMNLTWAFLMINHLLLV
ncbi:hypothetical protein L5515_019566 [Caenorhabditis briggsae]|uniref:Uncharacterized protein n=1 Tax=Caenorhabditis briggsae TaxID=6238 RepID=A0AAE9FJN4_CAEBR|nr:hypothetical protein L5515_019566 [Caenorhabditis briggsae]